MKKISTDYLIPIFANNSDINASLNSDSDSEELYKDLTVQELKQFLNIPKT